MFKVFIIDVVRFKFKMVVISFSCGVVIGFKGVILVFDVMMEILK